MRARPPHGLLLLATCAVLLMGAATRCREGDLGSTFRFEQDSVVLGRPLTAVGSLRYAEGLPYLPPDTATAYRPFELMRIDTLARGVVVDTLVDEDKPSRRVRILADSLRWHLRSFSIDSMQRLSLGYRVIDTLEGRRDTAKLSTNEDSVRFSGRWPTPSPAEAQPAFDFSLAELDEPFDWPGLLLVLSVLALLGGVLAWLLRRPVLAWLARRRLDRAHASQLAELAQLEGQLPAAQALVGLNQLWQRHLAAPDPTHAGLRTPHTLEALTTAELAALLPQTPLAPWAEALVRLRAAQDRVAYGGYPLEPAALAPELAELRALLAEDYSRRRRALA